MRYLLFILCLSAPAWAWSNDLLRNGAGANTVAVGGVTAMAGDPLAAMTGNPALLSRLDSRTLQIGVTAVSPDATYENRFGTRASTDGGPGILPDIAVAGPVNNTRWTVGAAVNMQSALTLREFNALDRRHHGTCPEPGGRLRGQGLPLGRRLSMEPAPYRADR